MAGTCTIPGELADGASQVWTYNSRRWLDGDDTFAFQGTSWDCLSVDEWDQWPVDGWNILPRGGTGWPSAAYLCRRATGG